MHISYRQTKPRAGLGDDEAETTLRDLVALALRSSPKAAGIDPAGLATHGGRRTVVTVMWDEGNVPIEDIANLVGHADHKTTEAYIKRRKKRPQAVAERAARVLDPAVA